MRAEVVEISGYLPAIVSLYVTGKNVNAERINNIKDAVTASTDRWGFVYNSPKNIELIEEHEFDKYEFNKYMEKIIKYGIKYEHETILDFIKISVLTDGLHRGAQDDFDAHAKRMDIIRSSTRASKKSSDKPEISDWYREKILPFFEVPYLPDEFTVDGNDYEKSAWGYVNSKCLNDPDVLRGNVGLSVACDNISTMSFRNWRHVYHLRRNGTHAAPELKEMVEQVREELYKKCWWLGEYLGKVWTTDGWLERNKVKLVQKEED